MAVPLYNLIKSHDCNIACKALLISQSIQAGEQAETQYIYSETESDEAIN